MRLLAVTVLTSISEPELHASGVGASLDQCVSQRARASLAAGAAGVVCSGLEAARLRAELGPQALIVCPGIRAQPGGDDQQRTVDVATAFANGADYIVVGRPIRNAADPRAAALAIRQIMAASLGE
jgi:orotidine-5'-phosphate decarboxylase